MANEADVRKLDVGLSWLYLQLLWIQDEYSLFLWWTIPLAIFLASLSIFAFITRSRRRMQTLEIPEVQRNQQHAFPKRDKVRFYARKVLRKGRDTASEFRRRVSEIKKGVSVPEFSRSGRRLQNRERMLIMAKQMFSGKKAPSLVKIKEIPSQVLEADVQEEGLPNLPEEVLYLLQSVKVFGHFEKGVFLQLCKHMETLTLDVGNNLFKVGDPDKWLYVVQEGKINLYIVQDACEVKLSEFCAGESLHSLLSILDVLTGHPSSYKTVFARAVEKSTIIRLPAEAFSEAFRNRKESLVQIVQVIMTRLQRVTFLALHYYLGLSQELLKPTSYTGETIKERQHSPSVVLTEVTTKHNLSTEDVEVQFSVSDQQADENEEIEDDMKRLTVRANSPRAMSIPVDLEDERKSKQIRFTDVDTVVDHHDNVFHRQSSVPVTQTETLRDAIKKAASLDANTKRAISENEAFDIDASSSSESCIKSKMYILNEPQVSDLTSRELLQIFGFDDVPLMRVNMVLFKVLKGYQLIVEGEQDVPLYYVIFGGLNVTQTLPKAEYEDKREILLYTAKPGMLTGQLAVLTGEPSFFAVSAVSDSVVACIRRGNFYTMMRKYPHMILNIAHTVMQRLSPFVRQIDFALDWMLVEAGKSVYKQGSRSDCMYIVLHGRLRSVCTRNDSKKELVAEFGKGEIVGMYEALKSDKPRATSIHAVRDTELAKIPEGLVKHIQKHHPSVMQRLISLASEKLLGNLLLQNRVSTNITNEVFTQKQTVPGETSLAYGDVSNHLANLSTVAILPASSNVPLCKFSAELYHALSHIYPQGVLRLDSDLIMRRLGSHAFDSVQEYRLSNWLARHEDMYLMVLYQTDNRMTAWTQRCIRQADAILIVGMGEGDPELGKLEAELEKMAVRSLKMLVLLHRTGVVHPEGTAEWLNMRGWLTDHIHIKAPDRLFTKTKATKMDEYKKKLSTKTVDQFSDFSRLARFLTGKTVALVLGGGGARGLSHIGVIQSLKRAGIPIDMVGGTSIGAFVGGLWAAHRDIETMREKSVILCNGMVRILPQLFDLTYPFTSMFSGNFFNKIIKQVFGDAQIEDLWLPYFNITTDITSSKMRVHTDGWLWRYVRSSMSLSGYLPPLCDPKDGHLLMDGGYTSNLPGDVARSRGAFKVIAVDVGSQDEDDFTYYGDHLSGWWLLWKRLTGRWTGRVKVPDLNDIQSRLSYISCNYLLEKVIHSDYCYYVRPPISSYKTLAFNKLEEISEVGWKHGEGVFTVEWTTKFWRDLLYDQKKVSTPQVASSKGRSDISFTDLAELLTQTDGETEQQNLSESDNEPERGYESSPEAFSTRHSQLRRQQSEPFMIAGAHASYLSGAAVGNGQEPSTRRCSGEVDHRYLRAGSSSLESSFSSDVEDNVEEPT